MSFALLKNEYRNTADHEDYLVGQLTSVARAGLMMNKHMDYCIFSSFCEDDDDGDNDDDEHRGGV